MQPLRWPPNFLFLGSAEFSPTTEQVAALGEPAEFDPEGDGLGSESWWGFEFECGLQAAVVGYSIGRKAPLFWQVFVEEASFEHLAAHTGWNFTWTGGGLVPDEMRENAKAVAVVRIDESGNRYDVAELLNESHARCFARILEKRGHKQTYLVERRKPDYLETEFPKFPPKWQIVRIDDNGNRFVMWKLRSRKFAENLVAVLDEEPRHKQAYFIEDILSK